MVCSSPFNAHRLASALAVAAFILFLSPAPARAVGGDDPAPPTPRASDSKAVAPKAGRQKPPKAGSPKVDESKASKQKKSEQQFRSGYRAAYALIYQRGDYLAGIARLRALDRDDHPDVANLIGFASRKLGRFDDAQHWYEKALAADPNHTRTWSYYGMWHAEQGDLAKAREHLAKVRELCGTRCRDYLALRQAIAGRHYY